mmetsp:Transcript_16204/g.35072  ORF Transcript_16204/g.35072 Transcript_16204/m.35072 type:complete len:244 (-) Transcript_16204:370-1101(-)
MTVFIWERILDPLLMCLRRPRVSFRKGGTCSFSDPTSQRFMSWITVRPFGIFQDAGSGLKWLWWKPTLILRLVICSFVACFMIRARLFGIIRVGSSSASTMSCSSLSDTHPLSCSNSTGSSHAVDAETAGTCAVADTCETFSRRASTFSRISLPRANPEPPTWRSSSCSMSIDLKLDLSSSFSSCICSCSASILARSTMSGGIPVISGVSLVAFHGYLTTTFSANSMSSTHVQNGEYLRIQSW